MKQRGAGFQKRVKPEEFKQVGLARIIYYGDTRVECSCGWSYGHHRAKVLEDAVDNHFNKRHQGKGIRL